MKKTIICSIPMKNKETIKKQNYVSSDKSLSVADREVKYAISSLLENNLNKNEKIKVILLAKSDGQDFYKENIAECMAEILTANKVGAQIEFSVIETEFLQEQNIHEEVLSKLIDEIDIKSHIMADITFGSKDLPILIFTALNFAEKFLECEIDNIIYTKATFVDGEVKNVELCDMIPLYYLNSLTNTVKGSDPEKAKEVFKSLLSF